MTSRDVTDAELQAAFLAARGFGKVLQDDVLKAIILAAREATAAAPAPQSKSQLRRFAEEGSA